MMPDLYRFTDYRAYLREWFEETKKDHSFLSFRYMSKRTGIDAGYLAHVFQGAKHIAESSIASVCALLGLNIKESKYFHELVLFTRAKSEREIKERFQRLMVLRSTSARELSARQTRYWTYWYYPAVRLTMMTFDFKGDYADLANHLSPAITPEQAKEAVQVLESLELVRKEADGCYSVLDAHVSSGDAWQSLAIREFQEQTLRLAAESLERFPKEVRDISTLTLAIPRAEIPALQELVREFRSQVAKWALSLDDSDCVMQVDLAMFPLGMNPAVPKASLPTKARRTV
jgi:uncharacterized protein (TIGR02147 family)